MEPSVTPDSPRSIDLKVGREIPARSATSSAVSFLRNRASRMFEPISTRRRATAGSGGVDALGMEDRIAGEHVRGKSIIHIGLSAPGNLGQTLAKFSQAPDPSSRNYLKTVEAPGVEFWINPNEGAGFHGFSRRWCGLVMSCFVLELHVGQIWPARTWTSRREEGNEDERLPGYG